MFALCMVVVVAVAAVAGQDAPAGLVVEHGNHVDAPHHHDSLNDTDLLLAFVVFRHGDRTPDQEELELYPEAGISHNVFFPYGMKALTTKGKQRGFLVGKYLRRRYGDLVSQLYLPDEMRARTTDYSRTKMTVLTALAALYPPKPAQRWNPSLAWQPIPYDTLPFNDDDLLYWYNCPRYLSLRDKAYQLEEVQKRIRKHESLYQLLSKKTGMNITKPEDVFYLDNLFQTLENVNIKTPEWATEVMPEIKEVTKLEFEIEFYNDDLIRLANGVLMAEIINSTSYAIKGDRDQPKLRLYSAHENNVAAIMAGARAFVPHQPKYGATFSLEFRRHKKTGVYGFAAVYVPDILRNEVVLPISGCGGRAFCDFDTFLTLTQDTMWSKNDFKKQCSIN